MTLFCRVFIAVLSILTAFPSAAMDIMTRFETPGAPFPNRLYLNVSGEIVGGDAQLLKDSLAHYDHIAFREIVIYLDSPGGSLAESLEIAEILRSRPEIVRTNVGGLENASADCASACVFVFAAGDLRYLAENGRIGVHQFFSSDPNLTSSQALGLGQALSSDIVALLEKQEISTAFFEEMAYTPAAGITWVDRRQLTDWRVVTGDVLNESMEYENINGSLWLRMEHQSIYGENRLMLTCNQRNEIVGVADLDEPHGVSAGEFYVVIDGVSVEPAFSNITGRENYRTKVIFQLAAYQARLLAGAGSFGARVMDVERNGFWGFEQEIRTERMREMVNGCGGGNAVQPGLRTEPDVDLFGADLYPNGIRNVTLQTCIQTCTDDNRCVAISYIEAQNWCWPKFSTSGRRPAVGITSIIKP